MNEQSDVHGGSEYYLAVKNEWTIDPRNNLDESQRIMLSEKKMFPSGYILNYSLYITFLKWQNHRNEGKINGY